MLSERIKLAIINKDTWNISQIFRNFKTLLKKSVGQRGSHKGIIKYFEMKENKNTIDLEDAEKAVFKEKFVALNDNIRKDLNSISKQKKRSILNQKQERRKNKEQNPMKLKMKN